MRGWKAVLDHGRPQEKTRQPSHRCNRSSGSMGRLLAFNGNLAAPDTVQECDARSKWQTRWPADAVGLPYVVELLFYRTELCREEFAGAEQIGSAVEGSELVEEGLVVFSVGLGLEISPDVGDYALDY